MRISRPQRGLGLLLLGTTSAGAGGEIRPFEDLRETIESHLSLRNHHATLHYYLAEKPAETRALLLAHCCDLPSPEHEGYLETPELAEKLLDTFPLTTEEEITVLPAVLQSRLEHPSFRFGLNPLLRKHLRAQPGFRVWLRDTLRRREPGPELWDRLRQEVGVEVAEQTLHTKDRAALTDGVRLLEAMGLRTPNLDAHLAEIAVSGAASPEGETRHLAGTAGNLLMSAAPPRPSATALSRLAEAAPGLSDELVGYGHFPEHQLSFWTESGVQTPSVDRTIAALMEKGLGHPDDSLSPRVLKALRYFKSRGEASLTELRPRLSDARIVAWMLEHWPGALVGRELQIRPVDALEHSREFIAVALSQDQVAATVNLFLLKSRLASRSELPPGARDLLTSLTADMALAAGRKNRRIRAPALAILLEILRTHRLIDPAIETNLARYVSNSSLPLASRADYVRALAEVGEHRPLQPSSLVALEKLSQMEHPNWREIDAHRFLGGWLSVLSQLATRPAPPSALLLDHALTLGLEGVAAELANERFLLQTHEVLGRVAEREGWKAPAEGPEDDALLPVRAERLYDLVLAQPALGPLTRATLQRLRSNAAFRDDATHQRPDLLRLLSVEAPNSPADAESPGTDAPLPNSERMAPGSNPGRARCFFEAWRNRLRFGKAPRGQTGQKSPGT